MFNADTPIKSGHSDLLQRATFAQQLATAMLSYNQSDCFSIGLYGEWGSGKTSVINMVIEEIEMATSEIEEKPIVLKFNPWLFSDQVQLTTQFFKQLSSIFGKRNKETAKKIGSLLETFGGALEFTKYIPLVGDIGEVVGKVTKDVGKGMGGITSNIQELKDKIVEQLNDSKSKMIIIIDDIDRLPNNEIRSVFQLIKSIADFPNTIYLLAFDYEIVTKALGDVQNTDGALYLEKIIQVPFHLPPINDVQLTKLLLDRLNEIVGGVDEKSFDKARWSMLFHSGVKPFIATIRDAVRFLNTFALKYAFLKGEVDLVDLIGITVLQVFEPGIFSIVADHSNDFCGSFYFSGDDRQQKEFITAYEKLITQSCKGDSERVKELLSLLFPKVSSVMKGGFNQTRYDGHKSICSGNIYNANYFDRYFSLSISDSLSIKYSDDLLFRANEIEFNKALLEFNQNKQINLFMDYVKAAFINLKGTDQYLDRVELIITQLSLCLDKLKDPDENQFFSLSPFAKYDMLTDILLLVTSEEKKRLNIVVRILCNENISLSTKVYLVMYFERQHNRCTDKIDEDKNSAETTLSINSVCKLEVICFGLIKEKINDGTLIDESKFSHIQWFIESLDDSKCKEDFSKYILLCIDNNNMLAKLVSSFISHGKGASTFVYDTWNMDYTDMEKYFSVDEAIKRMTVFVKTTQFQSLKLNIKEDIIAFLAFYEIKEERFHDGATRVLIKKYTEKHQIELT